MDMKLEVWVVPVSDVYRSKAFYESLTDEARAHAMKDVQGAEDIRRRRVGEGRDVDQEERRRCGRVDSRAGAM